MSILILKKILLRAVFLEKTVFFVREKQEFPFKIKKQSLYRNSEKNDEKRGSTMDLHSVKTRKILMYSNLIATSSNVIQVGISLAMGKANSLHNFDLGGFIHTLYRIATDTQFIAQIKQEFILNNFDKMIQGDM